MKRATMAVLIVMVFLVVFAWDIVEGGRKLIKSEDEEKGDGHMQQPQNFAGGFAGFFPSPGFTFTGSFPNSPGIALGFGFGPSTYCSFPGMRCATPPPTHLTNPGAGGGIGSP